MRPSSLMTGTCAACSLALIVRVNSSITASAVFRFASTRSAQALVRLRLQVFERQFFQLVLDLAHPQAVGDGRVDIERLLGNLDAPLLRKVVKRAHVVQTIGELHQDDADVIHHRQQHLAEVFRLPLFAGRERNCADFGDAFDDVGDFLAEQLFNALGGGERILDDVVEQPGRHGRHIELHFGKKVRDFERMNQIRLTRMADLPLMLECREYVGAAEQLKVGLGAVTPHFFEERFETNHENRCLNS